MGGNAHSFPCIGITFSSLLLNVCFISSTWYCHQVSVALLIFLVSIYILLHMIHTSLCFNSFNHLFSQALISQS